MAPIYPAGVGLLLIAMGAVGFAVRRGHLAAVISVQVMGLGGLTALLAAARAHGVDGQAAALILLVLLCVQGVVTCTLIAGRDVGMPESETAGGAATAADRSPEALRW